MASEFEGIPDDDIWNIEYSELEFKQEIARGSFGKVYKGAYLGVEVAIKLILRHDDPAYVKYIEREISVLKGIRHPFIVGFCGVCLHDTGLYIVTEYVDGGDVRNLMKNGDIPWFRRIQIASDLAKAIFYLHSKKIIHRDLKSKNLLIGTDGRVRLCDFGFARVSEFRVQRAMTICGTPGFVAPEIMLGNEYSFSCDAFSYGNVLAELITFRRPGKDFWIRTVEDEYLLDLAELRRIAPKDCPSKFLELAISCCAYSPSQRPEFVEIVKSMKQLEAECAPLSTKPLPSPVPKVPEEKKGGILSSHRVSMIIPSPTPPSHQSHDNTTEQSYLQTIATEKLELSNSELIISSKHLSKMVARATHPDMFDNEYIQDLLLTYPCFTKPTSLLEVVIQRYNSASLESFAVGGANDAESIAKKQHVAQMRIIVFLNTWIEKYYEDFIEEGMSELITTFDTIVAASSPSNEKDTFSIEKSLVRAKSKKQPNPERRSNALKPLDPASIASISALQLARQITYCNFTAYKSINPREYLKEAWKRRQNSNVANFLSDGRRVTRWIATALVKTENKEQRTNLLTKFIDIAQNLLNLKDFHGFFAVMAGLQHPSVDRLTLTFQGLKPPVLSSLKAFKALVSKDDHYKNYKAKQELSTPPTIPFIDVYLDELSYIDSFNPDIGKGGIINFSKHRKIARIVRGLDQYKASPYPPEIASTQSIYDIIMFTQLYDDDALMKKSLSCEQPSSFMV